jgi:hypothetical protein
MKNIFWKVFAVVALASVIIMFFTSIGLKDRYSHFQNKHQSFGHVNCTDYILDRRTGKIYELDDGKTRLINTIPKTPWWKSIMNFVIGK